MLLEFITLMNSNNISVFVDISGSVGNFVQYWNEVSNWYSANKSNITNVYFWDDGIKKGSCKDLEKMCVERKGYGCTCPNQIAKTLMSQKIKENIVIFTDGEVSDRDVSNCDFALSSWSIDNVDCYIISNSNPNLSVTCPFTRNNTSRVFYKNKTHTEFTCQNKSRADFEMINQLESINLETFNEKYSLIESLLIAKNMGKMEDSATKELLLKLKKNLSRELANLPSANNFGNKIRLSLKSNDFNQALETAKQMTEEYFSSNIGMEVEKKINYLISLCGDMRGQYSIESIRSNRMQRADNAKVETSTEVDIETNELTSKPIECPILMDSDVPQIMIVDRGEPILANLDKNIVDDIANCPLRILNYPEVVEKVKRSISQWTGIKANDMMDFNPFTKEKLVGTIPLGSHPQHVDCGNYTIAKMFSAGKIMGNLNLYWAVIWHLVKSGTFEYLNDIKDQATEHLVYRLTNSTTYASMCGLPQFVLTRVPTDVAIWYCVNSCLLDQPTDRDTVRFHMFNLNVMIDILGELGYPISDQTFKQINRTKVLMSMLSTVKRNETEFRNKIYCLYQNAVQIDTSKLADSVKEKEKVVNWIPIDGPASEEQQEQILNTFPKYYQELTINELVGLAKMVSPSLSASAIKLETNWEPEPGSCSSQIKWTVYGLNQVNTPDPIICPVTFRPYYMVQYKSNLVPWTELIINECGSLDKIMSVERRFIDFFMKYDKFPNQEEYLLFCYNRYWCKEQTFETTLPYHVVSWYQRCLQAYKPVLQSIVNRGISSQQVKQILNEYAPVEKRLEAQTKYLASLQ